VTEGWKGTGFTVEAPPEVDRIPPFDPRSGDHIWLIITAYRVDPARWTPGHSPHLDTENLVSIVGPGCYYCERPYSERLARRRCPGEPTS